MTYESARQEAFSQLGNNVKQWSDYQDVVIDDQHMVRIGITYLDPILVQYVVLNYALAAPNNLMDPTAFITLVQTAMNEWAQRSELMLSSPSPLQIIITRSRMRML